MILCKKIEILPQNIAQFCYGIRWSFDFIFKREAYIPKTVFLTRNIELSPRIYYGRYALTVMSCLLRVIYTFDNTCTRFKVFV